MRKKTDKAKATQKGQMRKNDEKGANKETGAKNNRRDEDDEER
jgi:hypothetical protein